MCLVSCAGWRDASAAGGWCVPRRGVRGASVGGVGFRADCGSSSNPARG